MLDKVKLLSTAGGKIACLRCQAMSKRTRFQCGRPALKISKTQKCQFHGGASTGPRTEDGRRRIGDAHLVTGNYTKDAILESSHTLLVLRLLEDLMHVLKMTDVAKIKPMVRVVAPLIMQLGGNNKDYRPFPWVSLDLDEP